MKRIAVKPSSRFLNSAVNSSPGAWLAVPLSASGRSRATLVTPVPPGPPGTRRVAPKPSQTAFVGALAPMVQLIEVVFVVGSNPTPDGTIAP